MCKVEEVDVLETVVVEVVVHGDGSCTRVGEELGASKSFGVREETSPLSTCTSSSTHVAPALVRSVFRDG